MSERDEQITVFQILEFNERYYPELKYIFAVPNGAYRSPKIARQSKAEGQKSGVLDICLPFARRGYSQFWIEMKFGDNDLTANQKDFAHHFISEGYKVAVCRSAEKCLKEIENYLGIELKK